MESKAVEIIYISEICKDMTNPCQHMVTCRLPNREVKMENMYLPDIYKLCLRLNHFLPDHIKHIKSKLDSSYVCTCYDCRSREKSI